MWKALPEPRIPLIAEVEGGKRYSFGHENFTDLSLQELRQAVEEQVSKANDSIKVERFSSNEWRLTQIIPEGEGSALEIILGTSRHKGVDFNYTVRQSFDEIQGEPFMGGSGLAFGELFAKQLKRKLIEKKQRPLLAEGGRDLS